MGLCNLDQEADGELREEVYSGMDVTPLAEAAVSLGQLVALGGEVDIV